MEINKISDARASLRILTDNQTQLLQLFIDDHQELENAKRELNDLRKEHQVTVSRLVEVERETARMLEAKQKAEAERDAIRKESTMAVSSTEEARQRTNAELVQLRQQFHSSMKRQAKSRQEMEREMLHLMQQLQAERRKTLAMSLEKSNQDMAHVNLQQRYSALERMVSEGSGTTGNTHTHSPR